MPNPANVSELVMENKKLTRQLELVLSVLSLEDVDVPCPSTVGLGDNDTRCGIDCDCGECWKRALGEIEIDKGEEDKCQIHQMNSV